MQARINLYFDDIEKLRTSGIKMFDYRLTTPEQEKNYQEPLNTVCQKIYDFKKAKDAQEKLKYSIFLKPDYKEAIYTLQKLPRDI